MHAITLCCLFVFFFQTFSLQKGVVVLEKTNIQYQSTKPVLFPSLSLQQKKNKFVASTILFHIENPTDTQKSTHQQNTFFFSLLPF